ncbi:MAG: tRNA (adenosine(37)-N6)-threonylcarbamoyltransferase complex dimerization subunit type 1 TsaB [Verrucomicrobiales bacterium]|nr:tRNA (adenosine(37)-N6)-threonylcarbamoyltransferase complex dimerization subunit type 1 TsaB [Verrucomicrobiales bacterium]
MLLALECSSATRSVALWEADRVVASRRHPDLRQAGVFALIEQVLAESGIPRDAIGTLAIGLGPGSYTGIRAAIAIAQGWELATRVRLRGVSSAEVCAQQCHQEGWRGDIAVVIDAQRQECYLAPFRIEAQAVTATAPIRLVSRAEARAVAESGVRLVGPELEAQGLQGSRVFPDATALARLAAMRTDDHRGDRLEPIYLRATSFVKAAPPRVTA